MILSCDQGVDPNINPNKTSLAYNYTRSNGAAVHARSHRLYEHLKDEIELI